MRLTRPTGIDHMIFRLKLCSKRGKIFWRPLFGEKQRRGMNDDVRFLKGQTHRKTFPCPPVVFRSCQQYLSLWNILARQPEIEERRSLMLRRVELLFLDDGSRVGNQDVVD